MNIRLRFWDVPLETSETYDIYISLNHKQRSAKTYMYENIPFTVITPLPHSHLKV